MRFVECQIYIAVNEQGFAMVGYLKNVKPRTAADWKTNVKDNNQKPTDVCPARTKAAMLLTRPEKSWLC